VTVRSSEQRRHRLIEEAAVNFFQGSGVIFKICTSAAWQIGEGKPRIRADPSAVSHAN